MRISDWSSDVCSSDLPTVVEAREQRLAVRRNRFNDGFAQRLFEAFERGKCEPGRYQALADDGLGKAVGSAADFGAFGHWARADRKSAVEGKSGSGRVDRGGRRNNKKKKTKSRR